MSWWGINRIGMIESSEIGRWTTNCFPSRWWQIVVTSSITHSSCLPFHPLPFPSQQAWFQLTDIIIDQPFQNIAIIVLTHHNSIAQSKSPPISFARSLINLNLVACKTCGLQFFIPSDKSFSTHSPVGSLVSSHFYLIDTGKFTQRSIPSKRSNI